MHIGTYSAMCVCIRHLDVFGRQTSSSSSSIDFPSFYKQVSKSRRRGLVMWVGHPVDSRKVSRGKSSSRDPPDRIWLVYYIYKYIDIYEQSGAPDLKCTTILGGVVSPDIDFTIFTNFCILSITIG